MSACDPVGEYRSRLLDAGRCLRCSKPSRPDRTECEACADKRRARELERDSHKRARYGTRRCGECREPGHDRRRCKAVKP